MSTPNVREMMRAIRGQLNRGLRDLSSTMAWMSASLGPFGPGFRGQSFEENRRRYLRRTNPRWKARSVAGRTPIRTCQESSEDTLGVLGIGAVPNGIGPEDQGAGASMGLGCRHLRQRQLDSALGHRDIPFHQRGLQEERVGGVLEPARPRQLVGKPVSQAELDAE